MCDIRDTLIQRASVKRKCRTTVTTRTYLSFLAYHGRVFLQKEITLITRSFPTLRGRFLSKTKCASPFESSGLELFLPFLKSSLNKTLTYFLGEHMKAWKEFQKKYGEGTAADLDYGKLAILVIVIYIAIQVT